MVKDRSEPYQELTPKERTMLRRALRCRAAQRTEEERRVVRKYWAGMRARSRAGHARINDLRTNQLYRAWLVSKGMPADGPFDQKLFNEWVGEGRP